MQLLYTVTALRNLVVPLALPKVVGIVATVRALVDCVEDRLRVVGRGGV